MKRLLLSRSLLVLAIALMFAGLVGNGNVLAQETDPSVTVDVTSPTEGEVVSGIVPVSGSVSFPDFQKYDVFLAQGDTLFFIASIYSPVQNNILVNMDSRTVPDGGYQLMIRTVRSDSNYTDYYGPVFTIENGLGAPLAHPEVYPAPLYAPEAGALARIKNCSGFNMEFDYNSPDGFCSSGDLWIMGKETGTTLCTAEDVFLIPCEYRGTIFSEDGQGNSLTYSFIAEAGKVYEISYPGGAQFFITEVEPEDPTGPMMSTPAEAQPEAEAQMAAPEDTGGGMSSAPAESAGESDTILPVSGQAASSSMLPFAAVASSLILLMVIGGVVAIRKGKQAA